MCRTRRRGKIGSSKIRAELKQPFDMGQAPLLRCLILSVSEDQHVLIVVIHHMIADSWSLDVLMHELAAHYNAIQAGKTAKIPELSIQYADWAVWQRGREDRLAEQRDYWRRQLRNLPVLRLPTDASRPSQQTFTGKAVTFELPASLTAELESLNRDEGTTLFMSLLAVVQLLLGRYLDSEDVVVGCPVANRQSRDVEVLLGCFVNNLVMRGDLSGSPTFRDLLRRVRQVAIEAFEHQDVPFENIVEELQPARDLTSNPLFQVLFAMQQGPAAVEFHGLKVRSLEMETIATRFDLEFHAHLHDRRIRTTVIYNVDLFNEATIRRLIGRFEKLVRCIVSEPDSPTTQISLAEADEMRHLLIDFNQGHGQFSSDQFLLHNRFEAQVHRIPEAVAVVAPDGQLTYRELDQHAQRIQRALQMRGAERGDVVGVCMSRGWGWIGSLIGILKAGCAFMPLDSDWPIARLAVLLEDSSARFLLTELPLAESLDGLHCDLISAEQVFQDSAPSSSSFSPPLTRDDLAYIMYTSGSTGCPKGVMVSHRAVLSFLDAFGRRCEISADDVWFSVTPATFDISILEVFMPLTLGGRVILASRQQIANTPDLLGAFDESAASVVQTTPTRWRMLLDGGYRPQPGVKMLCGGEELSPSVAADLLATGCEVWNLYGPTEATVWATAQRLNPRRPSDVSLGRPLENTTAYILDQHLQVVPPGLVGELFLGGDGLARGYRSDPRMTAEHFLPNPFDPYPGSRLYRTGDRASWTADGRLIFKGRGDDQVKVRGQRVQLSEIESALRQLVGIRDAVVVAEVYPMTQSRLVGYVVTHDMQPLNQSLIRQQLSEQLPLAMIPAVVHQIDFFPRTPHGKIDRASLEASELSMKRSSEPLPARTPLESQVAEIWRRLLNLDAIGIDDNFFDLGGHSMLLVQLQHELEKLAGVQFAILDLFRYPTVAEISKYLAEGDTIRTKSQNLDAFSKRIVRQKQAMRRRRK